MEKTDWLIHEFKLLIPVTMNGERHYAYVDTCATTAAVTATAGGDLETVKTVNLQGAFASQEASVVRLPQLQVLGKEFHDSLANLSDVPSFAGTPFPVHLLLGVPELLAHPLMLDFQRHQIGFMKTPTGPAHISAPYTSLRGLPLLTFRLGNREVVALFDTAAGFSVLNAARREELGVDAAFAYTVEVNDPTGATAKIDVFKHPQLSLGNVSLGPCHFLSIDLTAVEERLETRIDFALGLNTMLTSACVWVIDPHEGRISMGDQQLIQT